MKKYIFVVSLLCLLAACTGKRQGEAAVEIAALPAVEDVVMYQVNPRVFAPEKSFKAVERRLDSIQALGINPTGIFSSLYNLRPKTKPTAEKSYRFFGLPTNHSPSQSSNSRSCAN